MPLTARLPDPTALDPAPQCILAALPGVIPDKIDTLLKKAGNLAGDPAQMVFFFTERFVPSDATQLEKLLTSGGWMVYHSGSKALSSGQWPKFTVVAVRSEYNPVAHARQLAAAGRPDCAISVLNAVPETLINDHGLLAGLALERQRYYFLWQQMRDPKDDKNAFFNQARREFAQVTALKPLLSASYRLHADYWSFLGRHDMAARVLRSLNFVQPEKANEIRLSRLKSMPSHAGGPEQSEVIDDTGREKWKPRILIISHDHSDDAMGSLYHGLRSLLGQANVVRFPCEPTLAGKNNPQVDNPPCCFQFSDKPGTVDQLVGELKAGKFDFILFGDVAPMAYPEHASRLCSAAAGMPVILYDSRNDCSTSMKLLLDDIGRHRFDLVFKREMIKGVDYGPKTFPLPVGYPQDRAYREGAVSKEASVFWAGKRAYGLRPLYIPALEKKLKRTFQERIDQETYQAGMRESLIGLSFFGCGFDTLRYWELPANQVMLLAERPPIRIPFDFADGESAVFFDDLPDLLEKLDYYSRYRDQAFRIAQAGHAHFLRYHTTTARAGQFLARIKKELKIQLQPMAREESCIEKNQPGFGGNPATQAGPDRCKSPLHLGLIGGEGYGWGVCSNYLIRELSRMRPVKVLNDEDGSASNGALSGPLFQALINVDFDPMFPRARGKPNIGYTFFENELTPKSLENAKKYDLVLGGSSWCRDRMLEKGIRNCDVLIQGIDPNLFYPIQPKLGEDRFVIFSGGKFELRKGQDLVLRAVKIMQDKYPDVWLVNCWFNLWSASTRLMTYSNHIQFRHHEGETWAQTMHRTYVENGLDPSRIITHELLPQSEQRELFAKTDIGIFPNRCEGGTNLVLMEYMACARPVIASNTSGHKDIITSDNALMLNSLSGFRVQDGSGKLMARWEEPSLDELIAQLDFAYHHRSVLREVGTKAGMDLMRFSWSRSAGRLDDFIDLPTLRHIRTPVL